MTHVCTLTSTSAWSITGVKNMTKHAGTTQLIPLEYLVKCGFTPCKANWAILHVFTYTQIPTAIMKYPCTHHPLVTCMSWLTYHERGREDQTFYILTDVYTTGYLRNFIRHKITLGLVFPVSQITRFCCNYIWNLTCTSATVYMNK